MMDPNNPMAAMYGAQPQMLFEAMKSQQHVAPDNQIRIERRQQEQEDALKPQQKSSKQRKKDEKGPAVATEPKVEVPEAEPPLTEIAA